jgi:hypothetical protein
MSYYSIAVEKQVEACQSAREQAEIGLRFYQSKTGKGSQGERVDLAYRAATLEYLHKAQPLFWARDTAELVRLSAASLDATGLFCSPELLTIPTGFCWFDRPWGNLHLTVMDGPEEEISVSAVAWSWLHNSSTHTCVSEQGWLMVDAFGVKDGKIVNVEYNFHAYGPINTNDAPLLNFVIAANAFLRQRLLVKTERPLERHALKRLKKEGRHFWPTVGVVHLRAYESAHPRREGQGPVDWSCRWFVRGHWRNQPYKIGIRPRYVLPYLKGPDNKPIKSPAAGVLAVTR